MLKTIFNSFVSVITFYTPLAYITLKNSAKKKLVNQNYQMDQENILEHIWSIIKPEVDAIWNMTEYS